MILTVPSCGDFFGGEELLTQLIELETSNGTLMIFTTTGTHTHGDEKLGSKVIEHAGSCQKGLCDAIVRGICSARDVWCRRRVGRAKEKIAGVGSGERSHEI